MSGVSSSRMLVRSNITLELPHLSLWQTPYASHHDGSVVQKVELSAFSSSRTQSTTLIISLMWR